MRRQDLKPGVVYVVGKLQDYGGPLCRYLVVFHPDTTPRMRDGIWIIPWRTGPAWASDLGLLAHAHRWMPTDGGPFRHPTLDDQEPRLGEAERVFAELGDPVPDRVPAPYGGPLDLVKPRSVCSTLAKWVAARTDYEDRERARQQQRDAEKDARRAADHLIQQYGPPAGFRRADNAADQITVSAAWLADLLHRYALGERPTQPVDLDQVGG